MSHEANPELIRRINAAVWERDASQAGEHEVRFKCPAHDDKHPSAFWNATKGVWNCRACDARGGCLDLARRLGVELPPRETVNPSTSRSTAIALSATAWPGPLDQC